MKIPKSVYWIGDELFAGCKSMDNIKIPENIDRISKGMFEGCENLKKIEFTDSLLDLMRKSMQGKTS